MHYLIYIPKHGEGSGNNLKLEERLIACGLSDHVEGATPLFVHAGPDGGQGYCIGWGNSARRLNYAAESQTWSKSIPQADQPPGEYWVGTFNASPPTEGELRRPYTQSGRFIALGDDKWKLPTPDSVDKAASYNDDGSMRWETVRSFAWLCDEAAKLRDEFLAEDSNKMSRFAVDPSEFVQWLLRLLRVNYRMTPEVAVRLELWRASTMTEAVLSSLGLQIAGGDSDD